ncbi:MAG: hypothetical protein M1828_003648 [Chrysothrix sp. TS-e1954]|nr:MAG: hypothetical protein M1828_003648 [Chrysothrix sp. TS-e1954]
MKLPHLLKSSLLLLLAAVSNILALPHAGIDDIPDTRRSDIIKLPDRSLSAFPALDGQRPKLSLEERSFSPFAYTTHFQVAGEAYILAVNYGADILPAVLNQVANAYITLINQQGRQLGNAIAPWPGTTATLPYEYVIPHANSIMFVLQLTPTHSHDELTIMGVQQYLSRLYAACQAQGINRLVSDFSVYTQPSPGTFYDIVRGTWTATEIMARDD